MHAGDVRQCVYWGRRGLMVKVYTSVGKVRVFEWQKGTLVGELCR